MLSVIMLCVIMLCVIMLCVIMVSVVAPVYWLMVSNYYVVGN
jgi:hypothetical protein